MKENKSSQARSRLRWHIIAAWTAVIAAVAAAVFFTLTATVRSMLFDTEVEKLRPAVRELAKLSSDHFMSPSDGRLRMGLAKIMKDFPDASYLLVRDRDGRIHWQSDSKTVDTIKNRVARKDTLNNTLHFIDIPGEIFIDLGGVTDTQPQLPVHVGFAKSLVDRRMTSLLWNQGALALVILAGGLICGLLFSVWRTRALVEMSSLAEKMSLGDMNVRLNLKYKGEIGTVYRSLERLRESVLYASRRLDRNDDSAKNGINS